MGPEPSWYAARCVFRHTAFRGVAEDAVYEERIILLRAECFEGAIRKAEEEAGVYASATAGAEYLGYAEVYHLSEDAIGEGTEVFSLMRTSELRPEEYLSRFFDTGSERSQSVDDVRGHTA